MAEAAYEGETQRQRYSRTWESLKTELASYKAHWREIADYMMPRRYRELGPDTQKGSKRNDKIINDTPTRALRTLGAGLMSGITSPSRAWFRYTLSNPTLAKSYAVRGYLHACEETVREVLLRSNLYNCLSTLYPDAGGFGTTVLFIDEDLREVVRGVVLPAGQYALASGGDGRIDTLYREVEMTPVQMGDAFGVARCSAKVREGYKCGERSQTYAVLHVVEPNREYAPGKADARYGKRWSSCWIEKSVDDERAPPLRESGYEEQPFMAFRWAVTGNDVYGTGPGMDCLGDVRALQKYERVKAELVEKLSRPPTKGPASLLGRRVSLLAGDFTPVDASANGASVEPILTISPGSLEAVEASCRQHEERINDTFLVPVLAALSQDDRRQPATATEIQARHEENLARIGPVLDRANNELYGPLLERVFRASERKGLLPPPPDEMRGVPLKVEFISIAAQAQRARDIVGLEQTVAFVTGLATATQDQSVLDKLDNDKIVDEHAAITGVKPDLLRSEDDIAQRREQRVAQQQAASLGQAATAAAQGAKTLSDASLEGDNALTRLINTIPGAAAAPAAGVSVQQ